jgi:monofunctional glycosyltransferase
MKRIFIAIFCLTLFVPLILGLSLWFLVPSTEIKSLVDGYVQVTVLEDGKVQYDFVSERPQSWVLLSELDRSLYMSFVISEDWAFFEHQGIDWSQLKIALESHLKEGKNLRGASTISQQVVKNLFLSSDRTVSRKVQEWVITSYMEKILSKEKILEVYLNIIEFGDGVWGIHHAADFYFKTAPNKLNVRETAFLAMLLPNPVRYSQSFRDGVLSEYAQKTIEEILEKLRQAKELSPEQSSHAKSLPLRFNGKTPSRPRAPVRIAPAPTQRGAVLDDDGSSFERRYQVDEEMMLEGPTFDPSKIDIPDEPIDVEFSLE